jgi:hypothetical protein
LTFDDSDVVHKYGYGRSDGQTEAIHAVLAHEDVREGSAYSPSIVASPAREKPFLTLYDEDRARDSKTSFLQLFDTFTHSVNPQPTSPITGTTPHRFPPLHLLPGRSVSGGGGGSGDDQVRGGAHRGVRDYPHLPKTEEAVEREERAGLVAGADSASHQSHESDGEDTYGRRVREDDESTLHLDYDLNALRNSLDYPTSSPRTPIAAMSPLGRPDSPRRPMGPR